MRDGAIIIRDETLRQRTIDLLRSLDLSKPWVVSISRHRKKRSLNANALYHKWVDIAAKHTGHTHDELHEYLKSTFCPGKEVKVGGSAKVIKTTTALSTEEFSEYLDRCHAFLAGELGLRLPLPEDLHAR